MGRCGLWRPEGWPGLEVGWALHPEVWGCGIATEAAAAWRNYAFEVLGADELISIMHELNVQSAAVAQRIGHTFVRRFLFRGHPCHIYGQRRPHCWLRRPRHRALGGR
ncbi:MAG: GNAT family N-acetyltransferase [Frankiaceae bacterium]